MRKYFELIAVCLMVACANDESSFVDQVDLKAEIQSIDVVPMQPIPCWTCHTQAKEQRNNFMQESHCCACNVQGYYETCSALCNDCCLDHPYPLTLSRPDGFIISVPAALAQW